MKIIFRSGSSQLCVPKAPPCPHVPGRKHLGHTLRFADDAPAESPTVAGREAGDQFAGLDVCHFLDGVFGDDSLPVEFAAAEDHLVELPNIGGRGEQPAGRVGTAIVRHRVEPVVGCLDRTAVFTGLV